MTIGQQDRSPYRKASWAAPRKPQTLAQHRAFAPLLGLWGAALAGLSILVLPASLVANAAKGSGLMLLGDQAQVILAALAALLLGGVMYLVAGGWKREARRSADAPSLVAMAARHVRAIDPQRDLGSVSFDEPIAEVPFAPKPPVEPAPSIQEAPPPPRALDLADFAELPGRNAVWVEDSPEAAAPAPVEARPEPSALRSVPAAVNPSEAALARLRATPPQELSLAEMVERFAGALHEHREVGPDKAPGRRNLAAREAALAEALKALAALSGHPVQSAHAAQDEPLRDALTSLRGLRGAA